ncbi:MAG TPA: non-ribosomal peptide synthetase, partial [Acidobacteria bacterium]|nr:non-ribosomal peptide synthetase [Acidobacteriota bacterium]
IEPGEIEVALLRHPALREAVVGVREERPGDQMLVAWVVPRQAAPPAEELRDWLRGRLPAYMVPAAFVALAELPVTANGKLDRGRLPDPAESAEESYTAPADAVEELLAGLFAGLLDRERVGTEDSFFTLGGHSLLATQLLSRIRERLGAELRLADLFAGPTVADLARAVRSARQAGSAVAPPVLPLPRKASDELPLSFAQQRLWFVDQLEPGHPAYNIPWAARLGGALDAGRLAGILTEVVRRHEALRTTFARSARGPVSRVQASRPVPLPVVSLEGLPEGAATSEIRRLVAGEALHAFDLAHGPLLRATLLRRAAHEHVLITVMHHIVSDGWSMGVLLREVGALYRALSAGAPSPLPELPIQYADFAAWQREWLQGEVLAEQLAWWRDELAGAPQVLELPADRPRPAAPTHPAGMLSRRLAPDLSRELAAFSQREGVTLFMTLLAAFGVLLGRLADQQDVLVGSPVANRNRREIEDLIGFFVNTLVLRVRLQGAPPPSFRELLARVRRVALGAYTHQDLPFERLVEELAADRADRQGGPPPLFQVMLGLQNAPLAPLELPGLAVSPLAPEGGVAKFDLTLQLAETAAGLACWLEYDAALFDRTTAERLLDRLEGLLRSALAAPDRRSAELPLLLEGERAQLVREWNDSASTWPREAALAELFAEHARAQPAAPAVVAAEETWSYGRLEEEANRLARHLRSLGVESEVRVGVAMERSPELVLALLAVIKAGGAYVPLDAGYPDERLRFMLDDAGVAVVLVHGRTRQRLAELTQEPPRRLVCVEHDRGAIAACSAAALPAAGGGGHLAYLTYTSGSTGRPKGVAVPQQAVVRLVRGTDYVRLGPADRVAHASNVSFDATTFEIWGALANGGAVVIIDREVALSPGRLAEHLRRERVTTMFLTTALFNQVVRDEPTAFYPLAHLMVGGEALDPALMARALSEGPPERLLQVYGPTESTTFAVWGEIRDVPAGALTVPLGRPLANTTAYVVDAAGALAALGQTGELWLGGGGLARGYLNRPDLTAEKFVPDGWGAEPGGRLYRTGDLVRWRPDGRLDFLGRLDTQVKIRGFRIEPGEVEAVLAACPGVRECAVLARRAGGDPAGGELRLVAYLVAEPGSGLREAAVRDVLQQTLPDYMMPAVFLFLDALPLNPNGKVDRAALPAPEGTAPTGRDDGFVAPRDPVEGLLAGIWEEVLGRDRVGVTDDFFALGGHSLLATQVVSRVRETFGVELPVHDLFARPTIAQLAAEIHLLMQGRALLGEIPPILPVPRSPGDELPLSFAQQRLWFVEQLEPDILVHNMPWTMRLTGALDPACLRRTLEEVVRRHEALRMTFHGSPHGPVSRVLENQPVPLPLLSLEGLPEAAAEAEVQRLGLAELLRPFDLERGPLLRCILLRLDEREHAMISVMHHIVSDGWSMGVLQREVVQLYEAFSRGDVSPLPELPIQYADFAVRQREWLQGEVLAVQLAYWRGALAEAPLLLELPTDRPRPAAPSHRGGALPARLPTALSRDLEVFSRREGVTPFMALLAAFGVLLGRLADQEDVLVGSPIANRNRREIEDLIGFFVNTLVLRVLLRGTPPPSFRELLGRVREAALGAYTHQDLPFERLVEELVTDRAGGHPPLVQTMFVLQNAPAAALELPGLTLQPFLIENGLARFDLTLVLAGGPEGFEGYVEYDAELFDRTTAERLLNRLSGLLENALAEPDRGVEDLGLLLPGEREQLVAGWNDCARPYPREAGLPELFAQVARERPEAPAIVAGEEVWTYRRLDAAANRLARRLAALGVGGEAAETPVGIAMERSPELVLGLLAILKAGGLYVPLDAGYPAERLAFLCEDTGVRIVLVHAATKEKMETLQPRPHLEPVAEGLAEPAGEDGPGTRGAGGDALAYVIYTSGSTGRPKGVAVTHRAIVRLVRETNYVHLGPGARLGHVANIGFDAATWEVWGALLTGGTVVVIPRETVLDPRAFATALQEQRVTSMFLTSSLFTRMAREVPDAFQHMSELLVGGEAVDPAAAQRVLAHRPPGRLLNGYGPTESTTFATWHPITDVPAAAAGIPIGLPLANTTAWVLDRWLGLVPPGSTGELCIGGDGLARGYWKRPELTAERFVPHPWDPGARLYRTGDLARRRPDGAVECLGRLDDQVKIRGFRIEPGEVEAALAGHPAIRECAVLARRDEGETRLVAYVVLHRADAAGTAESSLREGLRERLPDFMVPSAWVFLEALPLSANGKLDRRALPAPGRKAEDPGYVAPSDPIEETLAAIWAEVLGLDRIGATDDFFALGGHSLLATQVVTRVREVLGVELPLRRIFETPTLAGLARAIATGLSRSTVQEVPPLEAVPRDLPLPLSYSQQQFWFLQRMDPEGSAYTIFLPFHLAGRLDPAVLAWTLDEIVRRHEVLRTTFADVDGAPELRIAARVTVALPQVDLGALAKERREAELRRLAREERRRPFDLATGPLLRVLLVRLAAAEHAVLAALHHIAGDGWSLGVLTREIGEIYAARCERRAAALPDLSIQYADFAHWQRRWLSGEILEQQLAYWRERLGGARDALRLPTERPRHDVVDTRSSFLIVELSREVSAELAGLSRSADATLFMTLLAGYMVLLRCHAQQDDILVGTPIANRHLIETEDLIGLFTNTLVLRADLAGQPTFREVIARVREAALGAYAHQDLPFVTLVESLRLERDPNRSPLFQVWFALQNTPRVALDLPDLTLRPLELWEGEARHDLKLDLTETPEGIRGFFEYKTALFRPAVVERMARDLKALLELVARDPDVRLDRIESELAELARRSREQREDELERAISQDLRGLKGRTGARTPTVVRRSPGEGSEPLDEERR